MTSSMAVPVSSSTTTVTPCTMGEDLHKTQTEESAKVLLVLTEKSRANTEVRRATPATSALVVEVEKVECECCGLSEECTPQYITHVRGLYCGRWVCGLCAEAVKDERGRAGSLEEGLEDALRAHMNFCMEFNNPEKTSPVVHIAAAMRRLLRRGMDGSSPSRSAPSSPRRSVMSRSNSCITSVPRECSTSL